MARGGSTPSKLSLPTADTVPHVTAILTQAYPTQALMISTLHRLVERFVLAAGETRYVANQAVREAANQLVTQGVIFRRVSDPTDDIPRLYAAGGRVPYLYAGCEPVPVWNAELHEELLQLPAPRINPELTSHQPPTPRLKAAAASDNGDSERGELIVQLVRELAKDAESGRNSEILAAENERLKTLNETLKVERDEAIKQLRNIARAQRTISETLLTAGIDVSGVIKLP